MPAPKRQPKNQLIVVLGPTASGKSSLGISLARQQSGEIVSADSLQIYQDFDIGSAKVTTQEQSLVKHYLLDVRSPTQEITVAEYKELALDKIDNIVGRDKVPFLVGGTGLYISSIVDNLDIPRVPPNKELRQKYFQRIEQDELVIQELYEELISLDPEAAEFVEPHNPRRIIRSLEVIKATGQSLSSLRTKGPKLFNILQIGLQIPEKQLQANIELRTKQMFEQGLVDEVKRIIDKYGYVKPLEAIGYKEVVDYLHKKTSLDEAKELITLHTKQFAKRQMKWFQRDKTINWISNSIQAEHLVKRFLTS